MQNQITILYLCLLTAAGPQLAGVPMLPADSIWNTRVDTLPVHSQSAAYVSTVGTNISLHPDFGAGDWPPGSGAPIGIPYTMVPGTQRLVSIAFDYADDSDAGPYPIPPDAPIEGGPDSTGDRHILIVDRDHRRLYEIYSAYSNADGSWRAGSGAIFNLCSNGLRPDGWTSADAAGLPILPGLVRYDEVAAGAIEHAIRFTVPQTRRAYVWPGRHYASNLTGSQYPPMGLRFRLKADFNISTYPPQSQVILRALQKYGMILADNGSPWYLSGAPDERWDNDDLAWLKRVKGASFEAVDSSGLMLAPDSDAVRYPAVEIRQMALTNGGIHLRLTNTFPGPTNVVELGDHPGSGTWSVVGQFLADTTSTNWTAPLSNDCNRAFYRISTCRP